MQIARWTSVAAWCIGRSKGFKCQKEKIMLDLKLDIYVVIHVTIINISRNVQYAVVSTRTIRIHNALAFSSVLFTLHLSNMLLNYLSTLEKQYRCKQSYLMFYSSIWAIQSFLKLCSCYSPMMMAHTLFKYQSQFLLSSGEIGTTLLKNFFLTPTGDRPSGLLRHQHIAVSRT